jgi:sialate O-acetylesterase
MRVVGDDVEISFDFADNGLMSKDGPLEGFTMAGEDKKFHKASASIAGGKVIVSCDQVDKPAAVRYAWANNPVCNLYSKEGLPASPFRTDDWKGVTADNH